MKKILKFLVLGVFIITMFCGCNNKLAVNKGESAIAQEIIDTQSSDNEEIKEAELEDSKEIIEE